MKIYCSGIGGIGLSAYAFLQAAAGHAVLGSDCNKSDLTAALEAQGIAVSLNQDGSSIPDDIDLFVYSEAIAPSCPERQRAEAMGVKQLTYAAALGELTADSQVIAVCGTHGKSSVTAMAARALLELEIDASVVVGSKLTELDGRNWRRGESEWFLVEACEYRNSFHQLRPQIIILTNCDGDHFDSFASVKEYQQAFTDFVALLPPEGTVITHGNDANCQAVLKNYSGKLIDADSYPLLKLATPGQHMQQNAQLVQALATELNLPLEPAQAALAGYSGCWRRLDVKGTTANRVTVIDDYAHHPVEIKATLAAVKEHYSGRPLISVFQPHMHNRTLALYDEFAASFSDADQVALTDVYDARSDTEMELVDVADLAAQITKQSQTPTVATGDLAATQAWIEKNMPAGSVLLLMGAGDLSEYLSIGITEYPSI